MSFYGSIGSQPQNEDTQESITNLDMNSLEEAIYDYIPRYKDDGDDTLSLFDFEDESLFEATEEMEDEDEMSQLLYKDDISIHRQLESMHDPLEFDDESQLNISPTPPSQPNTTYDCAEEEEDDTALRSNKSGRENEENMVIPDNVIKNISNQLVERQHHYHLTQIANNNNNNENKASINNVIYPTHSPLVYNYYDYEKNWQRSMWKSHGGARRFFMPLPNRRFMLMHHHEIEQVLRKQLSHMMLPDPLSADFYCGVTQAREGKMWEGFGVPGPGHVYIAKSGKYPKHNDGSPILPPGTLGKTAGFVSVHAPKSMISISMNCKSDLQLNDSNDENESNENIVERLKKIDFSRYAAADPDPDDIVAIDYRSLCREIELGYDHLMLVERCNASIFYVHEESRDRMMYATENGLINSRTQRDDMNIFNICLESRDQRLNNLIAWCNLNAPHDHFYRSFVYCDKGRKLMYRIFVLFEADHAVFVAMLKLLCAKIYLFATCRGAKRISAHDIEFGDQLKSVLNPPRYYRKYQIYNQKKEEKENDDEDEEEPELETIAIGRLSRADALLIFELILCNLRRFKHVCDRQILCSSRLICALLSVIMKVSRSNEAEWIEAYHQMMRLFENDLSFLIPSRSGPDPIALIEGVEIKHMSSVLVASARIRWELLCDMCLAMDASTANKIYNLASFWSAVSHGMWYYPSAQLLASKHAKLKEELTRYNKATRNKQVENIENLMNWHCNPYSTATAQSMHHYVNAMRRWLTAFKRNEEKQCEKEREHQINIRKQTKRQREYDEMLQQKKDKMNQRFKAQFFKALKEKNVNIEIRKHGPPPPPPQTMIDRRAPVTAAAVNNGVKTVQIINKKKNQKKEEIPARMAAHATDGDDASSCGSGSGSGSSLSDTASFLSLGIGVDPYDLNQRYYENIIKERGDNTTATKTKHVHTWQLKEKKNSIKMRKKENLKANGDCDGDDDDETLMMLAHGMQPVNSNSASPPNMRNGSLIEMDYNDNNNMEPSYTHVPHRNNNHRERRRQMQMQMQMQMRYNKARNNYLISPAVKHGHRASGSCGSAMNRNRYYGYNHADHYYYYYPSSSAAAAAAAAAPSSHDHAYNGYSHNSHRHERDRHRHNKHHHHHRNTTSSSSSSASSKKRAPNQYNHRYRSHANANANGNNNNTNNKSKYISNKERHRYINSDREDRDRDRDRRYSNSHLYDNVSFNCKVESEANMKSKKSSRIHNNNNKFENRKRNKKMKRNHANLNHDREREMDHRYRNSESHRSGSYHTYKCNAYSNNERKARGARASGARGYSNYCRKSRRG